MLGCHGGWGGGSLGAVVAVRGRGGGGGGAVVIVVVVVVAAHAVTRLGEHLGQLTLLGDLVLLLAEVYPVLGHILDDGVLHRGGGDHGHLVRLSLCTNLNNNNTITQLQHTGRGEERLLEMGGKVMMETRKCSRKKGGSERVKATKYEAEHHQDCGL